MNSNLRKLSSRGFVQVLILVCLAFFVFTMGFIGIITPDTHAKSLQLTPVALMLSLLIVLLFAENPYTLKSILIFILIAVLGYFIEVIGIRTHRIFGNYTYGKTLGFSLFNTPLIIGFNWLFLVYTSSSIFERFDLHTGLKIVFASLIMLIYDIVIEPVATKTDMWSWVNSIVPFQNYVAWFLLALLFHFILKWGRISTKNPIAPWVLLCQFLFFLALRIFLK